MSIYKIGFDDNSYRPLTKHSIVLDLDETLVHSCENMDKLKNLAIYTDPTLLDLRSRIFRLALDDMFVEPGAGVRTSLWGVTRPYLTQFLSFCFAYFDVVAIWSAGQPKYVAAVVDAIFRDVRPPHIVYDYDDCIMDNNDPKKPLIKMILTEEDLGDYMSLAHTFVLDDRETTFSQNPDNGIIIPAYVPEATIEAIREEDRSLQQLMIWLMRAEVMQAEDIRTLDKTEIFK